MLFNKYGYKGLMTFEIKEFYEICTSLKRISARKSQWLKLIKANRLVCPETGLKVHRLQLDVKQFKNGCSYHFNFYSECGELFTVDHIIPKSKGGHPHKLENLQPMIAVNNWKKGNTLIDI